MGKMKEYFGRGFIGILDDSLKITINNDEYYDDGVLKKLNCEVENEDELDKIKTYVNRKIKLKVTGIKTIRRKEEFNFEHDIYINKIIRIADINTKIRFDIEILNLNNEKEISKLLKESIELLFYWHLERSKGNEQEAEKILQKKFAISQKIVELGGNFEISEELFNEGKQEFLKKRLEQIERLLIRELPYDKFGRTDTTTYTVGKYHY
ncbi:hypothetical protein [Inconstantimicrobium mannanitabidum]|uniref:Uncharacterized protein n=1 Tax=Inconstantimicrobium mannanitabidum TaxID=1604901 RepID=A0ACB5R9V3_9CLOT|nr:hypothetical protein [Clostridium sp. TW13]GKX65822.1 hypothetical protein rsdtw13_10800 [Clostridium sp. TW13]